MKRWILLLSFLGIILSIVSNTLSQVIIEESVDIPNSVVERDTTDDELGKLTVLSKTTASTADVPLPEGGSVMVTIVGGAAAAKHDLYLLSPIEQLIVQDANANHGYTWASPEFPEGTTLQFALYWYAWHGQSGWNYGAYAQQVDDSTYMMYFEDIGISPMYVDLIVEVRIAVSCDIVFTIEIPGPKEVWPDLPPGSGGNPGDRHKKTNIVVTLKKNLKPVEGQNITTRVSMLLPSGGHDHTNHPSGNLLGELYEIHSGIRGIPEITAPSIADGTINITYTAPEFSGVMELTASTNICDQDLIAKDRVTVRVPGLVLLPDRPPYYTKVGGTCSHHGPSDMGIPVLCKTPDNNHYGTSAVNDNIWFIAIEWYLNFPQEYTLFINDVSLPYGGLFDKYGNWQPPHNAHRIGKSADIRTEFPWEREGVPIRSPRKSLDKKHIIGNRRFERICRRWGSEPDIHGEYGTIEEHYHLEFQ